jgi:hypothetical protein
MLLLVVGVGLLSAVAGYFFFFRRTAQSECSNNTPEEEEVRAEDKLGVSTTVAAVDGQACNDTVIVIGADRTDELAAEAPQPTAAVMEDEPSHPEQAPEAQPVIVAESVATVGEVPELAATESRLVTAEDTVAQANPDTREAEPVFRPDQLPAAPDTASNGVQPSDRKAVTFMVVESSQSNLSANEEAENQIINNAGIVEDGDLGKAVDDVASFSEEVNSQCHRLNNRMIHTSSGRHSSGKMSNHSNKVSIT